MGSVIAACLWVLAATVTAFLPMRRQYVPGLSLLVAAPLLMIWLWVDHGPWIAGAALAGFVSMFRNPLIYFWKRATGQPVKRPEEMSQ